MFYLLTENDLHSLLTWVTNDNLYHNLLRINKYFFFSVSLLKDLPEEKLAKIVDCLEIVGVQDSFIFLSFIILVKYSDWDVQFDLFYL